MNGIFSVLVTGAEGLLGRVFCQRLVLKGVQVTAIVSKLPPNPLIGVNYKVVDLSSDFECGGLVPTGGGVVHLAQSNRYRDFPEGANDVLGVNVISTAKLLASSYEAKVSKFVFASSGGVYVPSAGSINEESRISNFGDLGFYLGSKACGEILTSSYSKFFDTSIIRPFFMYGPGQKRGMLIPRIFDMVNASKPITLAGEDGLFINPVHVKDASAVLESILYSPGSSTINISGPEVLSIRQIAVLFGKYLNKEPVFQITADPQQSLVASTSLVRDKYFTPRRLLADHLNEIRG